MSHIISTVHLERKDLNSKWFILFTEPINNEKAAEHLDINPKDPVVVIHHRIYGFLVATVDALAEIRLKGLDAHKIVFRGCLLLWPEHFCSKEVIKSITPFSSLSFSVHPDTLTVEADGHDEYGYPSVHLALGLI